MLNKELYNMIYRRKSFHLFLNMGNERLSDKDICEIEEVYKDLVPLCADIKTKIRILPAKDIGAKGGIEYGILIYSEKKDNYLANVGYIGQQLDLWLVSKNIGTLWCGLAKPDITEYEGLDYVIMIMIARLDDEKKFRKDIFKAKRMDTAEIWQGEVIPGVSDISRFAPSACNSQPWRVENGGDTLTVYRFKKPGKSGIMPAEWVPYFNRIDMGIYLCFLELCLDKNGIKYERVLFADEGGDSEKTKTAVYKIV